MTPAPWLSPGPVRQLSGHPMQRARVRSSDFGSDGFLSWDYRLTVPQQGPLQIFTTWRAKAVLAWNSRVSEFNLFGIQFLASSLRLDLDL